MLFLRKNIDRISVATSPITTGRGFWGLTPTNKAPRLPNWNMKHYKSVEILPIFRVSSPPAQAQSPQQKRKAPLLKTFWRRFWLYWSNRSGILKFEKILEPDKKLKFLEQERSRSVKMWLRPPLQTTWSAVCIRGYQSDIYRLRNCSIQNVRSSKTYQPLINTHRAGNTTKSSA